MTGFIIGVLFINFWNSAIYIEEGILSIDTLERLRYFEIDNQKFFAYILQERMKVILLMVLIATTVLGVLASYAYLGWLGMSLGIILATMTLRFGIKGSLLFLCMIFPQYLFYIPMAILLVNWCIKVCMDIHFKQSISSLKYQGKKQELIKRGVQLGIIIGVVIIGSFLECYVNPIFVNNFVKLF